MLRTLAVLVLSFVIGFALIGCGGPSQNNAEDGGAGTAVKEDDGTVTKPTANPETGDRK
jgi:hypothetical protein